jgi:hypothetical protein
MCRGRGVFARGRFEAIGGRIFAGAPDQIEGFYLRINAREDR